MSLPQELADQDQLKDLQSQARSLGRVKRFAWVACMVFALGFVIVGQWRAALELTCCALVVMINFLWLEEVIGHFLQPAPQVNARRILFRILSRFALFGVALSVVFFIARFNALSVLLGFSVIVVGIMAEALYSAFSTQA